MPGVHGEDAADTPESLDGRRFAIYAVDSVNGDAALLWDTLTGAGGVVERVHPGGLDAEAYDGLVALGGTTTGTGPASDEVVEFVRAFFAAGKPVAVLGGAVRLLLDADVVRDRTVTCAQSLRAEILDAGGNCVDYPVVADHGLVTGATADAAEAFATRTLTEFAVAPENPHDPRSTAPP